jgi:hypothetical protein
METDSLTFNSQESIMTSPQASQVPEYSLTLNDQDLQVIMQALENLAFKLAAPLVNKIAAQLNTQTTSTVPPQDPTI